ncbi:MAG: AI-2E family transporter [Sphingobium sp.]|nr:AI-2E family transporter [Sphingobium sp.]
MTDEPAPKTRAPRKSKAETIASEPPHRIRFEDGAFLALVLAVTIGFALVLRPYFGAILWALILAMLFGPLNKKILGRIPGRPNTAAVLTLLFILFIVIIPAILLGMALVQEFLVVYQQIQSGQINIPVMFEKAMASLPHWLSAWLASFGWTDFSSVSQSISEGLSGQAQNLAGRALKIGQGTLNFILTLGLMLYLTFFFLRDGDRLQERVVKAVPLEPHQREAVVRNFAVVIRATVKGSLVVALIQGLAGGLLFWGVGINGALLWGVFMGAFSLIPAVGTGIIWVPMALYLLATGALLPGFVVVGGGFLISMIDNVVRPLLVGRDTRMPDYVILISTLGGLQLFGISGFVIGPVVAALFIGTWNIFTQTWRKPA